MKHEAKVAEKNLSRAADHIAYFSMEIALDHRIPTYSGGLGVLAGDTLRSAADLAQPFVALSLLYHRGYFNQHLTAAGKQTEEAVTWRPADHLRDLGVSVTISLEGRPVEIGAWQYDVVGVTGHIVPVILLDTRREGNSEFHKTLTDSLYGGDEKYRLCQEAVLGLGGVAMLEKLGYKAALSENKGRDEGVFSVRTYHMNEGHAALLTLALLGNYQKTKNQTLGSADMVAREWVKKLCVFTTHTPVPAGHDSFPEDLVRSVLTDQAPDVVGVLKGFETFHEGRLNMSWLALRFSRFVNGVAKRHGEVSRQMFPNEQIAAITNGIHVGTWTPPSIQKLFDRHIHQWRVNNFALRHACELPLDELVSAHQVAKDELLQEITRRCGVKLKPDVFTIGFARRAAEYKRGDLLFSNPDRLKTLAKKFGGLQVVFAGKAHPRDLGGKAVIEKVWNIAESLRGSGVEVAVLENYDVTLGRLITSGVDLWLNNPLKPLEASGTSGMKASVNGVPNFSTLDGWWVEGHVEGVTGWEIEDPADAFSTSESTKPSPELLQKAAANLYDKLEKTIMPLFKDHSSRWAEVMRHSIALNGPHFSTQRMVLEYVSLAYRA